MSHDVQTIYVHDTHEIRDDGETVEVPSLNTYGDLEDRESLADAVSKKVDFDKLSNEVGNDLGEAVIKDGVVEKVNLYYWVTENYGIDEKE